MHMQKRASLILVIFGLMSPFTMGQVSGDWSFSRRNPEMTGTSDTKLKLPLTLAWQFATMKNMKGKGEMMLSSAVVRNGKVYLGSKDGLFFCLELATGKKLWEKSAPKGSFEGAAGFSGENVIAGCTDSYVYAWNAETGLPAWKFETEGDVHAAVNVWTDPATKQERLFIGSYDNNLYCLDPKDGKKIWSIETGNYINGGSPISVDGKLAFGGCDMVLRVHDAATGRELKQIDVGSQIANNPALVDGVAYFGHYGNKVEAYSLADGAKIWEYGDRDFEYYAAPAVFEKIVVIGGRDKRLHGLDRVTGKPLWEFKTAGRIDSSAVICGGKHAVFGSDDGFLYVVEIETGKSVWQNQIGAAIKTSPAVAGDWVIVGADDGVVYAFKNSK
jgi:outer membrane protein assembly factor BamB